MCSSRSSAPHPSRDITTHPLDECPGPVATLSDSIAPTSAPRIRLCSYDEQTRRDSTVHCPKVLSGPRGARAFSLLARGTVFVDGADVGSPNSSTALADRRRRDREADVLPKPPA